MSEDTFKYEYGADFPDALDILSMAVQGRKLGKNFSPVELVQQLNVAAQYKERTPRRPGIGKRLEPSKYEGEQEIESRKRAQADCYRLVVPKAKDEIPDIFIRRLDAHRTATEALIVPMTTPELNTDFVKRMVAVKANEEPNVIILPRGEQESEKEFEERMNVAKETAALVFPRGKSETADDFKLRLASQKKAKKTIMPKGANEKPGPFERRCGHQQVNNFVIHPFDPAREDDEKYECRLKAHRDTPQIPIEPGDPVVLKYAEKAAAPQKAAAPAAESVGGGLKESSAVKMTRLQAETDAALAAEASMASVDISDPEEDAAKATKEKEAEEARVKEAMAERLKAAEAEREAARAAAEAEASRKKSFDDEAVDINAIGFMALKKLLMERGVPKDAVFSAANKFALKDVAAKHDVKIVWT